MDAIFSSLAVFISMAVAVLIIGICSGRPFSSFLERYPKFEDYTLGILSVTVILGFLILILINNRIE